MGTIGKFIGLKPIPETKKEKIVTKNEDKKKVESFKPTYNDKTKPCPSISLNKTNLMNSFGLKRY